MTTPGFFEIFPEARPVLPAGEYTLETDQDLTAAPPDAVNVEVDVPGVDVHFDILAPRYDLPPDQLLSTFPPAGAVGDWSQRLPQIVCKRRTLPWERNPDEDRFGDGDKPPPWLALVVLAEGEGALSTDADIAGCVTPGVELDGANDTETGRYLEVTATVRDAVFPTESDLARLAHVRRVDLSDTELALGDDDGYMAVVMANRLPQPGPPAEPGGPPTSRNYTAYLINVEGQLHNLPADDINNVEPDFQAVMVTLVSPVLLAAAPDAQADDIVMKPTTAAPIDAAFVRGLDTEDDDDGDGDDDGAVASAFMIADGADVNSQAYGSIVTRGAESGWAIGPGGAVTETSTSDDAAKRWLTGETLATNAQFADVYGWHLQEPTFRFPVLLSWDFVCTGDGTFESLMNELDTAMLGTADDEPTAPEVAPTGHIALDHTTRRGEPATVWYRGPLVPLPTERGGGDGNLPIAHSADEIRPVVPDGREDVGRAAAFEIGRLLALSKPGIVAAMTAWREELFGASRAASVADEVSALPGASDALTVGGRRLDELLATELIVPFAERAPERIGPRMQDVAVSRPPEAIADIDPDAVLTGLGVDPGEVDIAIDEVGAAGWSTLAPRTFDSDPGLLSDDPALVRRLSESIDSNVELRAAQALKLNTGGFLFGHEAGGDGLDDEVADVLDSILERGESGGTP